MSNTYIDGMICSKDDRKIKGKRKEERGAK